jgi:hypothetical protein
MGKKVLIYGALAAAIIAAMCLTARSAGSYPPPVYVTVAGYYTDGKLVNVKAFPEEIFHDLGKCQEEVAAVMLRNQADGRVLRVTCLPFPETAE